MVWNIALQQEESSITPWARWDSRNSIAEQWIGQHLLDLRLPFERPEIYYWVREKAGSMAEVDYLTQRGSKIFPVEVKAGPSTRAKSLDLFLAEKKKSPLGIHFSSNAAAFDRKRRVPSLPFYLIEQLPRLLAG